MHRTRSYFASLMLIAALATPIVAMAAPQPQGAGVQIRVYDRNHKDYHNWDDSENRAYVQYRSEKPKNPPDFSRGSKKQQSDYWNWRHSHPDHR